MDEKYFTQKKNKTEKTFLFVLVCSIPILNAEGTRKHEHTHTP